MIWHSSDISSVLDELSVDKDNGLPNGVAYERLEKYGKNQITEIKPVSFFKRFLSQLNSKSVYILIIISIICFAVSLTYRLGDYYSPFLIIAIVILNAVVTAYNQNVCDKAIFLQKAASIPVCTVIREGIKRQIPSNELVVGDIIVLDEGDYICADARLLESSGLRCNEIALTGEIIPVEKDADAHIEDLIPVSGRKTMVFSGTSVIHGSAKAVVVETGLNTEIGKSAFIINQTGSTISDIEKKLTVTARIMNVFVIIFCSIVFIIGMILGFSSHEPFASITVENLLNAVALGVCAIPESLPFITVIVTALGTGRLLHDGIVIKNATTIETLSKTTVLCADKTGVFTHNHMSVTGIYDGTDFISLNDENEATQKSSVLLRLAVACSMLENDSTESAIEEACLKYGKMTTNDVNNSYPRLSSIPFDADRKMMTSINMIDGKPFAIIKGAPEAVIEKCVGIDKIAVLAECEKLASNALRLICIAIKGLNDIPANPNAEDIEQDLKLAGVICLEDPPRLSSVQSVEKCRDFGIKVIMITGDNATTANAVAKKIGICFDDSQSVTGQEIEEMSEEELQSKIASYAVFARISPAQKLRIVRALQTNGEIVTVTGNSIEDADVLSVADVGFAIGADGHDVARGNADAIIKSNNFSAIVNVFSECRSLFQNIKDTVHYLISCNASELLIFLMGLLIFKMPPLLASQLLWINLLTDAFPAFSLAVQSSGDIDNYKTSNLVRGKLFDLDTVVDILIQALTLTLCGISAFAIGNIFGRSIAYTMAFLTISLSQIIHSFNIASKRSVIFISFRKNKFMAFSTIVAAFICLFLSLTPAGFVFGLQVLNTKQVLISLAFAILIVPICEIKKTISRAGGKNAR